MTRYDRITSSMTNYWGSIASDIVCSLTLLIAGFSLGTPGASCVAFLGGTLWYSLCEYSIHRWIYHGERNAAAEIHDRHHGEPRVIIGAPFYYSLSICGLHGLAIGAIFGVGAGLVFGGAMLFSFVQQSLVHHSAHRYPHVDILGVRSSLRRHHALHHAIGNGNYGMSTTLWDRVFGTLVTARPRDNQRDACGHPRPTTSS